MTNFDLLFNRNFYGSLPDKDFYSTKKLGCQILSDATVLPNNLSIVTGLGWGGGGGVINNQGEFLHDSFMHPISQNASYTPKSILHLNDTAIYLGMFRGVWGHCLTDNIKRLWFLKSDLYRKHFQGAKLVYIPMWDFNFECCLQFRELIEILGLNPSDLYPVTNEAIQFKNLVYPDMSFKFYTYFTDEYRQTIDIIRNFAIKNYQQTPFKKIYLYHGRNQIGEERLANYFKSKGYAIIKPESLSFKQQLNLFIGCESFAAPIGSASHNMLFLKDNSEVILIPRAFYATGYQEAMNNVHNLNVHYIDSTLSMCVNNDFPWGGPFFYFLSDNLLNFFGDSHFKYSDDDFKSFIFYLKVCHKHKLPFSTKALDYYKVVWNNFFTQLNQRKDLLNSEGVSFK